MAWTNFQKSNWTRSGSPQKAIQYFPASVQGTVTGNITFTATQVKQITLTAAFMFKGNGIIDAWAPAQIVGAPYQTAAANAGLVIDNAWLQAPASGSYAGGNHPLIILNLSTASAFTTAAAGFDIICMES